jgi:DNA-binding CsgD family transcriptional regulator
MQKFTFLVCYLLAFQCFGQFEFSGEVNAEFNNATAYLNIVPDFNKRNHFFTENIIKESKIDASGKFVFKGDYLDKKNKIYKIYIDNCDDNITDSKHLLNQCDDHIAILFIAKNDDTIFFPLNDLSQMFCDFKYSKPQNIAIHKIDSLQETLLSNLQTSKNDVQRKIIYKNYFNKLQTFSKSLNEPLAELYAFYLYSDNESFSREYYLNDLKTSNYYNELSQRLIKSYPNSNYANQFKHEVTSYTNSDNKTNHILLFVLFIGLTGSAIMNFLMFRKNKRLENKKNQVSINYKEVLTKQEQKVFELMNKNISNKEIANTLFISLSTVKTHINNIYSKLQISSRKEITKIFEATF